MSTAMNANHVRTRLTEGEKAATTLASMLTALAAALTQHLWQRMANNAPNHEISLIADARNRVSDSASWYSRLNNDLVAALKVLDLPDTTKRGRLNTDAHSNQSLLEWLQEQTRSVQRLIRGCTRMSDVVRHQRKLREEMATNTIEESVRETEEALERVRRALAAYSVAPARVAVISKFLRDEIRYPGIHFGEMVRSLTELRQTTTLFDDLPAESKLGEVLESGPSHLKALEEAIQPIPGDPDMISVIADITDLQHTEQAAKQLIADLKSGIDLARLISQSDD